MDTRTSVLAEDAPLDVQLWPTRDDARYGANFTLVSVARVRTVNGEHVVWTYGDGKTRTFQVGDRVVVALPETVR